MKHPAPAPRRRQAGFALLITIMLLAFLVLLLVSLSALTRVETRVASNNQQLSQARQNAIMAMNVALGRLQAAAGPDTRVTATADLVSGRHIDKKNWTGVWNASAAGADKNIAWLVSGTAPAGSAGVTGALTAASGNSLVELVGAGSTDISNQAATGNRVQVETQPITSDTVPGMTGTQTVGKFAYWVGDEGVKAKVSVSDPWETPETLDATTPATTTAQADSYRFINSQRIGIEGVDTAAAGTPLASAYPADVASFREALPKILSLSQLPLANPASGATLAVAGKNRFHDLTAQTYSLLTDAANGGFKKDLTAWLADPALPGNPVSALAADDWITQGDSADTAKFGLPKWAMIRSYATTRTTGNPATALPPRRQTAEQQGIHPVVTYARMGFNTSCSTAGSLPKLHLMPSVALWNPGNVAIDKNTVYEVSFAFVCYSPQATPTSPAWDTANTLNVGLPAGGVLAADYYYINRIRNGNNRYGTGTANDTEFYRFKLVLSRDLGPGESRLFTIKDPGVEPYTDGTIYSSGNSLMSDTVVADDNSVYIPRNVPYTTLHLTNNLHIYTLPESISSHTRLEVLLTPPLSGTVSTSNIPAVNAWLRDNAYQRILGAAYPFTDNVYGILVPPQNTRDPFLYYRIELMMSDIETRYPQSRAMGSSSTTVGVPGAPRWLATFNPQASISLRKPFVEGGATTRSGFNPAYLTESFTKSGGTAPAYVRHDLPNAAAGTTNVSAGTQVSVTGAQAQNLIIREFLPADLPLFSIAQLQHVNVSTLNLNPAYAIGNSLANVYINRNDPNAWSAALPTDSFATATPDTAFPDANTFARIYDLSYLLNKTLWDGYYFSTVPRNLDLAAARNSSFHLPNGRHTFIWDNGEPTQQAVDDLLGNDPAATRLKLDTPASRLLVNGGFNVNSTSEQAWRALLYSHNGVATDPSAPVTDPKRHPFSRFASPATGSQPNQTWQGYRILSDSEIHDLARKIVAEVRARGPFLSLSDFVNRRLANDDTGLKGALQAAIDNSSVNQQAPFNYEASPPVSGNVYAAKIYPRDMDLAAPQGDALHKINYMGGTDATALSASRAAFAPGYLTQADMLGSIGPGLTARSDTFRIRSYGDTMNPATGEVTGRAWCEVVVQRLPDYLVPASAGGDASTVNPPVHPNNSAFGRRFKVVSFRWLSSDDI